MAVHSPDVPFLDLQASFAFEDVAQGGVSDLSQLKRVPTQVALIKICEETRLFGLLVTEAVVQNNTHVRPVHGTTILKIRVDDKYTLEMSQTYFTTSIVINGENAKYHIGLGSFESWKRFNDLWLNASQEYQTYSDRIDDAFEEVFRTLPVEERD